MEGIASFFVEKLTIVGSVVFFTILLIIIEFVFHKIQNVADLVRYCLGDILLSFVISMLLTLFVYNNRNTGSYDPEVIRVIEYREPLSQGSSSGSSTSTTSSTSKQETKSASKPSQASTKRSLSYISFSKYSFDKGQFFDVYSAPSTYSWHGTAKSRNGIAYTSTNGDVYVAGSVGQWLLIKYKINKGPYRMGYTSDAQKTFSGLTFDYYTGTITSDCSLTDGVDSVKLRKGDSITVLGRMDNGIYIEAYVNGQQARGTVPESCVSW